MQSSATTSTTDGKRLISREDAKRARIIGSDQGGKKIDKTVNSAAGNAKQNPEGELNEMDAGYKYALGH